MRKDYRGSEVPLWGLDSSGISLGGGSFLLAVAEESGVSDCEVLVLLGGPHG